MGYVIFGATMWVVGGILTTLFMYSMNPSRMGTKEMTGTLFIWPLFVFRLVIQTVCFIVTSIPAAFKLFNGV